MKLVIGADHGGVELKAEIRKYLDAQGYEYHDVGTFTSEAVDYPDIGQAAAEYIAQGKADRTREHNNANMMALGARVIGPGLAIELVDAFLHTDFLKDEPRHVKRVEKISAIEKKYSREEK